MITVSPPSPLRVYSSFNISWFIPLLMPFYQCVSWFYIICLFQGKLSKDFWNIGLNYVGPHSDIDPRPLRMWHLMPQKSFVWKFSEAYFSVDHAYNWASLGILQLSPNKNWLHESIRLCIMWIVVIYLYDPYFKSICCIFS